MIKFNLIYLTLGNEQDQKHFQLRILKLRLFKFRSKWEIIDI